MNKLSAIKEGIANARELCEKFSQEFGHITELRLEKEYLLIYVHDNTYGAYLQNDVFVNYEDFRKTYLDWVELKKERIEILRLSTIEARKKSEYDTYLKVKNNLSDYKNI